MIKGITPRAEYELVGGTKGNSKPVVEEVKQKPKKVNIIPKAEYSVTIND